MRQVLSFLTILFVLGSTHGPALAADSPSLDGVIKGAEATVLAVINWVAGAAGVIVVLMIVWGGLQYIQGNADGGKKTLLAALIGAAIVILAMAIAHGFHNLLLGNPLVESGE